jgi:two-component system chemotaxis response regulator CheY
MSGNAARRILVIEDDTSIREMIALVLEDEGHHVDIARDGQEALAILDETAPDLILLDMKMATMDGWQFAEHYRRSTGVRAPLVVMTAAKDAAARAAEVIADDYLAKPFDLDALLRVIEEHTR